MRRPDPPGGALGRREIGRGTPSLPPAALAAGDRRARDVGARGGACRDLGPAAGRDAQARYLAHAANEDVAVGDAGVRPDQILREDVVAGDLLVPVGCRAGDVDAPLLRHDHEAVADQHQETVPRRPRLPARLSCRGVDAGEKAAAEGVDEPVVVDRVVVRVADRWALPEFLNRGDTVALGQPDHSRVGVLGTEKQAPLAGRHGSQLRSAVAAA